jgi:hypothetical protein
MINQTYCDTGPPFLSSYWYRISFTSKRSGFLTLECCALPGETITNFKCRTLDANDSNSRPPVCWLVVYRFASRSIIFHLYGYITIYMETSPMPVKGFKIKAYARRSGPLSREGSFSCHTCCDMGPWFFRSHPKDRPI